MDIKRTKFNICLLGEGNVGKSTLISVYTGNAFDFNTLRTIGVENYLFKEKYDGENYKFKVFDTAGQERYKSISNSTIRVADGFLLVYSVAERKTFDLLNDWLNTIGEQCEINKKVLFLIGNKIDIEEREVSYEEAAAFAKANKLLYIETSAKSGVGVKETFQKIFCAVYEKYKELEKDNKENNDDEGNDRKTRVQLDKNKLKKRDNKNCAC